MVDKSNELPREFGTIQLGRRIALSKRLLEGLGWEIGDQVIIEAYRGKVIVENLSSAIRPIKERLE